MHDCHRSSKMVQQLVFIILSKVKLMFEILDSQSPKFYSREICIDFQTSLLITSGTCLFLSKGMRLRFQKCTQMCLFWYLVATPDTLYIVSLYYHFSNYSWTTTRLWDYSCASLRLHFNYSETTLDYTESTLRLLWDHYQLWDNYVTTMRLFWNCSETTLRLLWECSETTLRVLWDNSEIALRLLWDYLETTLKLL